MDLLLSDILVSRRLAVEVLFRVPQHIKIFFFRFLVCVLYEIIYFKQFLILDFTNLILKHPLYLFKLYRSKCLRCGVVKTNKQ